MTYQEWDKIWTINKKLIDPVCPRHTAVIAAGKVLVTIEGECRKEDHAVQHTPRGAYFEHADQASAFCSLLPPAYCGVSALAVTEACWGHDAHSVWDVHSCGFRWLTDRRNLWFTESSVYG